MRARIGALVGACALALAGCNPHGDVGYVEIRTVPVSAVAARSFYLDRVKLEPIKKGSAVLKQPVGTAALAIDGGGGELYRLCDIEVKKDRITSVTVSILDRPPRCQCRMSSDSSASARGRLCVS
jgi:hypothetical protein